MNNTIQIYFATLLTIFIFVYVLEEHFCIDVQKKLKYYYNELSYKTGLKERPVKDPFVGTVISTFSSVITILTSTIFIVMMVVGFAKSFFQIVFGVLNVLLGTVLTIALGFWSFMKSIWEFGILFIYVVEFFVSHLFCFLKLIFTAPSCMFWFVLETIGKILYLIGPQLLIGCFAIIGVDLRPIEAMFWKFLEYLDKIIFSVIEIHIIHFPKWVRDMCYNCKRLKVSTVGDQFNRFGDLFTKQLPSDARPGLKLLGTGFGQIMDALTSALAFFGSA